VTITGTKLNEALSVHFGELAATTFTATSPSSIKAVSPAGAAGTVDVTVTGPSGTSPPGPADQFSYGPPTVTQVSPPKGPAAGATTVKIGGSALSGATAVRFGAINAASYQVLSSTSISAVSPPATGGTVDVTVVTPHGSTMVSASDRYKYVPSVTRVSPNIGPRGGATSVTVTGTGFAPGPGATAFRFGSALANSVQCASMTSCTLLVPAHAAETVDVKATAGGVTSLKNAPGDQFTYS
jgi:hypothetical protein